MSVGVLCVLSLYPSFIVSVLILLFMFSFVASFWTRDSQVVHIFGMKIAICCNTDDLRSSKRL